MTANAAKYHVTDKDRERFLGQPWYGLPKLTFYLNSLSVLA